MPYALLMNRPELLADAGRAPDAARKLARERMDEAVQGIQSALNWRGVSLWPGGEPDVLVTAYAADFLLTMRESGAALPAVCWPRSSGRLRMRWIGCRIRWKKAVPKPMGCGS